MQRRKWDRIIWSTEKLLLIIGTIGIGREKMLTNVQRYNTLDKSYKTARTIGIVQPLDVAVSSGITCDGKALVHRNWQFPIANVSIDRNSAFSTCAGRSMLNVQISNNLGPLYLFMSPKYGWPIQFALFQPFVLSSWH